MQANVEALEIITRAKAQSDALWPTIDAMLPASRDREIEHVFGCCLDTITDAIDDDAERALVHATAMLSIPIAVTGSARREALKAAASAAYAAFIRDRAEDALDQVADFRADQRRDERVSA